MRPKDVIQNIVHPPRDCSQAPFWFWNGQLSSDLLTNQLSEMAAKGVYSVVPHPRFGMDRREYLEQPYWDSFTSVVSEAKRSGSSIILYDEYNWPSGGAGGRVTDGHPEYYPKGLEYIEFNITDVENSGKVSLGSDKLIPSEPESLEFEYIVAAFIVSSDGFVPWGTISDDGQTIIGDIVSGYHKLVVFFQALGRNPSLLDSGSGSFVDYLNPDATERFIQLTHEQYRKRYQNEFGTTIIGVFTDEPQAMSGGAFPWNSRFRGEFFNRRGYDLVPHLMNLILDHDRKSYTYRIDYWQTVAELFADNFLNPISQWCKETKLALTGHIYEENISAWTSAPHLMDWLRYFDWPGIDALGIKGSAVTSKVASSVAHLCGKEHFSCEALGLADGWNATLAMAKKAYQFLAVMGVDLFIPHAFHQTIENPRIECPPSFFYQNPYWKYYSSLAELTSRLSAFNRQGIHCAPVAVYYPIESLWADGVGGKGKGCRPWQSKSSGNRSAQLTIDSFNTVVSALSAGPFDCDIIDNRALTEASIDYSDSCCIRVGNESFKCIVIPAVKTISCRVLTILEKFVFSGGMVVFCGRLPERPYPETPEFESVLGRFFPMGVPTESIITEHGAGKVAFVSESIKIEEIIGRVVAPVLEFPTQKPSDLLFITRKFESSTQWLLVNDSDKPITFDIKIPSGLLYKNTIIINVEDGNVLMPRYKDGKSDNRSDIIEVALPEAESIVLISTDDNISVTDQFLGTRIKTLEHNFVSLINCSLQIVPHELDTVWSDSSEPELVQIPLWKMKERGWNRYQGWENPGFDDSSWLTATCPRGGTLSEGESVLFRAILPPGARSLKLPLPVTGEYIVYINGIMLEKRLGMPPEESEIDISHLVHGTNDMIALEVSSESSLSGLTGPIEVRCYPVELNDWPSWKELGLGWYSGRVIYKFKLNVDNALYSEMVPAILDLGKVEHYVEVWVNHQLCGTLLWKPYCIDIGQYLKYGDNDIALVVSNSLSNRLVWDRWGTRCGTSWGVSPKASDSGILGPVKFQMLR